MRTTRIITLATMLALGALTAGPALAGKASQQQKVVSQGVVLARNGNSITSLYKVHSSLYGNGAAVQHAKLLNSSFPIRGTDTVTAYYADGAARTGDRFTLGSPNPSGIAIITGTGKCTGGTGIHRHQRCAYKLTGTYNTKTMVSQVTATGTIKG